jgi:prepilin-type N-terminal cleavage/methylation domain-containing protein
MSRFIKKQGFTLIELMVVIEIIGVLASLASPRFTEASSKAKIAEAPRVLASYESGYLAALAETADATTLTSGDLIFEVPTDSRWFTYSVKSAGADECEGKANGAIGKFAASGTLTTKYISSGASSGSFKHVSSDAAQANKMVPNFCKPGNCSGS